MIAAYALVMGNGGQIELPTAVRSRAGLAAGTKLVLLEAPDGLVLLTRAQYQGFVRDELAGLDLVGDLLSDRRQAAADEDRSNCS